MISRQHFKNHGRSGLGLWDRELSRYCRTGFWPGIHMRRESYRLWRPRSKPCDERVQNVQAVQAVQSPSLVLPRVAGEETGEGLERLKRLERLEPWTWCRYRPIIR